MSGAAKFGPWIGVPKDQQGICAVEGCTERGECHPCFYDGTTHHHGCIHYDKKAFAEAGHVVRPGWGWLCNTHFQIAWELFRAKVQKREAERKP